MPKVSGNRISFIESGKKEHMITENLLEVHDKITKACRSVGRDPSEVTLICVSKTKPVSMIREAYEAGERCFGENKVQEIVEKMPELPSDIVWHMIGHLQRNKVKAVVGRAELIHSVDSLRLARTIEQEAERQGIVADVLLEVNVAEEETKFGLKVADVLPLVQELSGFDHIHVCGLMTIAPFVENPEENRMVFRKLKKLSVDISAKNINNVDMNVLSMGMTNDYEVAVQEGATMVRVGTGIFGMRSYD